MEPRPTSVPLEEYLRLERELKEATRMFAAVVWSMRDKRVTLWPPHVEVAPDLLLTRYDSPTNKSIVFSAELP